jgi:hypothetical protein
MSLIDPYMSQQIAEAKAAIDRLAPVCELIQEHAEDATRFINQIEEITTRFSSPFEKFFLQDRIWTYVQDMARNQARIAAWVERGQEDRKLISIALPKRGWYLSGQEPCTLSDRLANAVREEQWDKVDQEMMEHLPQFNLDSLRAWLMQVGVPNHCITRLCRFLKQHDEGNYEEATYLGVPLIDEIAKHLYDGKAFTTKRANRSRGDQSKPELAFKTPSGPELTNYCAYFVQAFGSLQEDPNKESLADENYWNRHAIVHGLMQRPMGIKDSAKCLTAINFLIFAREEEKLSETT